jgi:hypothetical protein
LERFIASSWFPAGGLPYMGTPLDKRAQPGLAGIAAAVLRGNIAI